MRKKAYLLLFNLFISTYYFSQTWVPATPFPDATGSLLSTYPINASYINSLTEYNGELYVGGSFTGIGGVVAHGIARWNGSSWSSVGPGNFLEYAVTDICVFNGELYFTAKKLYKWNGSNIELVTYPYYNASLDSTFQYSITGTDLHVFNNELYTVPGIFSSGNVTDNIVKFDGVTYSFIEFNTNQTGIPRCIDNFNNSLYIGATKGLFKLESGNWIDCNGITTVDPYIVDIESYNNELIVVGNFTSIGGITTNNLAKYNGTSWTNISLPGTNIPQTLYYMEGNLGTNHLKTIGNTLYLAHSFSGNNSFTPLRKYNGTLWSNVANYHSNYYGGGAVIIYNNLLYCGGSMNVLSWGNTTLGNFVRLSTPLGLENESMQSFSISPNPASDNLTVSIPEQFIGSSYTLCDQFGKTLFKGNLFETTNTIDLTNLASGIYFLSVEGMAEVERVAKN